MDNNTAEIELNAVLDTLVDGVIIINQIGAISLFNPACIKIFGYSPEEVMGKNVKILMPEPFHSEHDGYLENYKQTGTKKIIGIGRDVTGRRKDGTTFPMELAVGETMIGNNPTYVGIIRDVSSRHQQKKKYDQLQEEYFHLSRVSAMNEMGSAIAHELNQPMTASINYLETAKLLLSRQVEADKDKILDIIARAMEQTHRASDIIARMRGFVERGDIEKETASLKSVAETASRLAFLRFDESGINFQINIDEALPLVFINIVQVQQVFVNLLKNACEAMTDSPVKELTIDAQIASSGEFINVEISDTGHGLSEEQAESLFVPFSSEKTGGMGVGLSISQSIINRHDGQIWASSNQPKGTIFQFTLPIYKKD